MAGIFVYAYCYVRALFTDDYAIIIDNRLPISRWYGIFFSARSLLYYRIVWKPNSFYYFLVSLLLTLLLHTRSQTFKRRIYINNQIKIHLSRRRITSNVLQYVSIEEQFSQPLYSYDGASAGITEVVIFINSFNIYT